MEFLAFFYHSWNGWNVKNWRNVIFLSFFCTKSFVEIPSINVIPLKVVFFLQRKKWKREKERLEENLFAFRSFLSFRYNFNSAKMAWSEKTSCKRDVLILTSHYPWFWSEISKKNCTAEKEKISFPFPINNNKKKRKRKINILPYKYPLAHFHNFKNQNQQD